MLDVVLIIFFTVMTFRVVQAVRRESAIFREFNQSRSLAFVVLLFPFGPLVYITTLFRLGWLVALVLTLGCYVPAFVLARRRLSAFERAGTDRVKGAKNAALQALGTAIVGLVYAGAALTFALVGATRGGPGA